MGRFLRIFLFVFTFNVEVTIHASTEAGNENFLFQQEPENCWVKNERCAIYSKNKNQTAVAVDDHNIILGPETILVRESQGKLRLVQGRILVDTGSSVQITTEYGQVVLSEGKALVARTQSKVEVSPLFGKATIRSRFSAEELLLPPGYTSWFAGLKVNGDPDVGIPQPVSFANLIADWAALFPEDKKQFRREVALFKPHWQSAIETAGPWHKKIVERQLAAIEAQRLAAEKRRRAIQRENARLRKLFRQKTYHE